MSELRKLQNDIMWLNNPTIKGRVLRLEQHLGFEPHSKVSQVFQHNDDKIVKLLTRLRDLRVTKENAMDAIFGDLDISISEDGTVAFKAANLETSLANLAIVQACSEAITQLEAVVAQLDSRGVCYYSDIFDAVQKAQNDIEKRHRDLDLVVQSKPPAVQGREGKDAPKLAEWVKKKETAEQKIKEAQGNLADKIAGRDAIDKLLEGVATDMSPLLKPKPVDPAVRQAALDLILRNKPMGSGVDSALRLKVWEGKRAFAERKLQEAKAEVAARKAAL